MYTEWARGRRSRPVDANNADFKPYYVRIIIDSHAVKPPWWWLLLNTRLMFYILKLDSITCALSSKNLELSHPE